MADAIPDLWPDIEQPKTVPPVAILREQAAALGKKTGHLLEGRVSTRTDADGEFIHTFSVVAPTLDNYAYRLFSIYHGAEAYPVTVPYPERIDLGTYRSGLPSVGGSLKIGSEKELLDFLRAVLNSDKTKRVLGSLLAQAKAAM